MWWDERRPDVWWGSLGASAPKHLSQFLCLLFLIDLQSPSCGSCSLESSLEACRAVSWVPATQPKAGGRWEGECTVLTCKNDHVHPPKYTHNPANHHDCCQDLNQCSGNVQPEDTAHVPVREVGPGSTQHRESWYKCPYGESSKKTHSVSHGFVPHFFL